MLDGSMAELAEGDDLKFLLQHKEQTMKALAHLT